MLMSQGGVVCFHGTRSIGGYDSGTVPDTPVDQYITMLAEMERNTGLTFGGCHGYYGVAAREPVIRNGGDFTAILREPVKRTHSIYQANVAGLFALAERHGLDPAGIQLSSELAGGLADRVSSELARLAAEHSAEATRTESRRRVDAALSMGSRAIPKWRHGSGSAQDDNLGTALATLFFNSARDSVGIDEEIILACGPDDLIVMERMTGDSDYFREHVWDRLLPHLAGRSPLAADSPRLNDHAGQVERGLDSAGLFESWNPVYREALVAMLAAHPASVDAYRRVGYFIP